MLNLVDTWLPWLGDLLELGGPILSLILLIAFVMWSLLFERLYFLSWELPKHLGVVVALWQQRDDKTSWYAQQFRENLQWEVRQGLRRHFPLISTLIKVCPLLGLLGTVLGMLEVFDALAATGSNNARSMAAGISKATVTTLAGMVVSIFGLLGNLVAEGRANAAGDRLAAFFSQTQDD
ncbi:MotA/TolQ/ExbB proton channel family protein [Mangrovimicrobium sediminis]|uniref:MotA/TolQ/ExbB proton channel family protein n=1 Tax=Mangrovimicrobium sediminis TaxID=2562682 RepID=A0A4Z0M8X0_9GAMM|nr:MotA/TolQ/ExbB proton channel family protein [Haliea sp. SAOS-164]TGD76162.1 MotA/TolQ/ExbB proton channel family protein [Haliea sp. SAOS-164]